MYFSLKLKYCLWRYFVIVLFQIRKFNFFTIKTQISFWFLFQDSIPTQGTWHLITYLCTMYKKDSKCCESCESNYQNKRSIIPTNCGYTLFWQHMINSNASLMDFSAVYVALPPCKMQKRCSYVNFDTEWRVWLPNLDLTFNNWGHSSRPR